MINHIFKISFSHREDRFVFIIHAHEYKPVWKIRLHITFNLSTFLTSFIHFSLNFLSILTALVYTHFVTLQFNLITW